MTTTSTWPPARTRRLVQALILVVWPAAATAAVGAEVIDADSQPLRAVHHPMVAHPAVGQRLEQQVHALTRALDLAPEQQVQVRAILQVRLDQLQALHQGTLAGSADRTSAMLAIQQQARTAIRAVLTDGQQLRYGADVPQGQLAPAQANLQYWLDLKAAAPGGTPDGEHTH